MSESAGTATARADEPRAGAHIPLDAPVVVPWNWGRTGLAVVVVALLAVVVSALVGGEIQWARVPEYIVDPRIIDGIRGTLVLTAAAMAVGIGVGVVIAVMRASSNPVLRTVAVSYVWLFRAVPTLVQLLLWFNLALLLPQISIPGVITLETNSVVTPFLAAVLGLGLAEAAYMAEIVRGGIEGVDRGQVEAAKSLGMSAGETMRRIILPQATRLVVPPTGNETIGMLKYSSLAFVISYEELLSEGKKIYQTNFEVLEVLFACSFWYLVLVTLLSLGQRQLEKRLARGVGISQPLRAPNRWQLRRGAKG